MSISTKCRLIHCLHYQNDDLISLCPNHKCQVKDCNNRKMPCSKTCKLAKSPCSLLCEFHISSGSIAIDIDRQIQCFIDLLNNIIQLITATNHEEIINLLEKQVLIDQYGYLNEKGQWISHFTKLPGLLLDTPLYSDHNLLHYSIAEGNVILTDWLINKQQVTQYTEKSPLHKAITYQQPNLVYYFLPLYKEMIEKENLLELATEIHRIINQEGTINAAKIIHFLRSVKN